LDTGHVAETNPSSTQLKDTINQGVDTVVPTTERSNPVVEPTVPDDSFSDLPTIDEVFPPSPPQPSGPSSSKLKFSREDIISSRIARLIDKDKGQELLLDAVRRKDLETTTALLTAGIDPNPRLSFGLSSAPIHEAALLGSKQLVEKLLDHSADPWIPVSAGRNALDCAISSEQAEIVHLLVLQSGEMFHNDWGMDNLTTLIERTKNPKISSVLEEYKQAEENSRRYNQRKKDELGFLKAVIENDKEKVNKLLMEGIQHPDAITRAVESKLDEMAQFLLPFSDKGRRFNLESALYAGALEGKIDIVKAVHKELPLGSLRSEALRRTLAISVQHGHETLSKILVREYVVDIKYALDTFAKFKDFVLFRWLYEEQGYKVYSPEMLGGLFLFACMPDDPYYESRRCLQLAQFLLEIGVNVDTKIEIWGNALKRAASRGDNEVLNLLLTHGADVNAVGGFGGTSPLMAAVSANHLSTVQLLLSNGAHMENQHGLTGNLLQTASYLGYKDVVVELLNEGHDVNARGAPSQSSALMLALQGQHQDIAELLIEQGADVNLQTAEWGTALYCAATLGMEKMVKVLVEAGADVNYIAEKAIYGTALQAAVACGFFMIALLLIDQGADINAKGGKYGTALNAAKQNKDSLLEKLLLFSGAVVTELPPTAKEPTPIAKESTTNMFHFGSDKSMAAQNPFRIVGSK
jgi:ankyrin repeat protein